jgi:hypothetical protein
LIFSPIDVHINQFPFHVENLTNENISNVKKELQWISEKESIGPNKLRKRFLDDIQTETLRIYSINSYKFAETFKTFKLKEIHESTLLPLLRADNNISRGGVGTREGGNEDKKNDKGNHHDGNKHQLAKKAVKVMHYLHQKAECLYNSL